MPVICAAVARLKYRGVRGLSARNWLIFLWLLNGFGYKDIARGAGVPWSVVKSRARRIYPAMGVRGQHEMVALYGHCLLGAA